ncbi:MAG: SMC family ATPase [Actinomycetaceae bacterium]|nr:SMC family ATPase [Actinomycetaceae bacterium]
MRLLQLDFTAIGPFPGSHCIDFTKFEADGLYLLRGDTGSGKSTIIDALTFALFGQVAGGSASSKDRLRSNYAAPEVESAVTLRFEVNAGIFEVERRPEYVVAGRKTPVPGRVRLSRLSLDEDGQVLHDEVLATKIREVNGLVEELLGVNYSQFLQTVVLPQGQFAEFIRASSDSRKAILSAIFATAQFERFQRRLQELWLDSEQDLKERRLELVFSAQQISEDCAEAASAQDWDTCLDAASKQLQESRNHYLNLNQVERDRHGALLELGNLAAQSRRISLAKQRAQQLSLEESRLRAADPQVQQWRTALERAEAARAVLVVAEKESAAAAAVADLCAHSKQLEEGIRKLGNSDFDGDVEAAWESLRLQLVEAQTGAEAEAEYSRLKAQLDALNGDVERLENSVSEAKQLAEQSRSAIPEREAYIQQLQPIVDTLPQLLADEKQLLQQLEVVAKADALRQELKQVAEDIGRASLALDSAGRIRDDLLQRWLDSSAADLARHLQSGQPCPVCGSTSHPNPREMESSDVHLTDVERAQEEWKESNEAFLGLRAKQDKLTAAISDFNQQVGGQDEASLRLQEQSLAEQKQRLEAAREYLTKLEAEIETLRNSAQESDARLVADSSELATLQERLRNTRDTCQQLDSQVVRARGRYDTVAQRLASLRAEQELVQQLRKCSQQLVSARDKHSSINDELTQVLSDSQFASLQQAQANGLADQEMGALVEQVSAHERAVSAMQTRRADLEAEGLFLRESADTQWLESLAKQANAHYLDARGALQVAIAKHQQVSDKFSDLRTKVSAYRELAADSEPVRVLAQAAKGAMLGDNKRISLDTWVLFSQFDDVLAAANPHLQQFSAGRYQLKRTVVDAGSRSRSVGLGLAVIDSETDGERTPSSLSGGETFYTSLALALGLVEVISSYAGGIQFRSLIIDEGFGSLDNARLDEVMAGLEAMHTAGRTVGMVSHVTEMRNRIHTGVEVESKGNGRGSTLKVYG